MQLTLITSRMSMSRLRRIILDFRYLTALLMPSTPTWHSLMKCNPLQSRRMTVKHKRYVIRIIREDPSWYTLQNGASCGRRLYQPLVTATNGNSKLGVAINLSSGLLWASSVCHLRERHRSWPSCFFQCSQSSARSQGGLQRSRKTVCPQSVRCKVGCGRRAVQR